MKKLLAFLLCTIMIFSSSVICASANTVSREVEDNSIVAKATVLTNKITGAISSNEDVDYYTFNSTKDYFVVDFSLNSNFFGNDVGDGWDISIYDKDNKLITSCEDVENSYTSPRLAFIGAVYVRVEKAGYYCPTDIDYDITVTQTTNAYWESEYNDTIVTANKITPAKVYTGSLYCYDDVDYYKASITGDYFVVNFDLNQNFFGIDVGNGWDISIYDKNNKLLASGEDIKNSYTSPRLAFSGTIYIKINRAGYFGPTNIEYDVKITQKTNAYWESEYNNTLGTANKITPAKSYTGSMYCYDDIDYYKATITGDYFTVNFKLNQNFYGADVGDGWDIYIYDKNDKLLASGVDIENSYTSQILAFSGNIYIKVIRGGYFGPTNIEYDLKVTQKTDSLWENEYNESIKQSTSIKKDKIYNGSLYHYDDVDYYKLTTVAGGTISVKFSRDATDDDGYGYKVQILDKAGKSVSEQKIDNVAKGSISNFKVSKGIYYIAVSRAGYFGPSTYTNYKISYSFKLATPSFKKVISDKDTVKITWNRKSDVDGYELQYATNKSFSKAKTIKYTSNKTVSKILKKLSVNKKYYVRIRTFKKIDGKTNYSSWSKVKYATTYKLATPSLKKVTAVKNELKVTLNKKTGIDGYQIQYSTSKTFKKAKTVNVSKSKSSVAIKNLLGNKKYYVRIRTVKKVDGIKRYSSWSKVKYATTYKLDTPSLKKVTGVKKELKVTLNKKTGIDGYEIQYSTSKTFKKAKTVNVSKSKSSVAIKKLSANKKYYVRVRTVKKVDGIKRYSSWSKAKYATTKK